MKYDLKNKSLRETRNIYNALPPDEKEEFKKELTKISESVILNFQHFNHSLADYLKEMSRAIGEAGTFHFKEMVCVSNQAFADLASRSNESISNLKRYGWIVSGSMCLDYISLKEVDVEQHQMVLAEYFETIFKENNFAFLNSMLDRWRQDSYFSERYHILFDCVDLYRRSSKKKDYFSVIIPTLLTQVDGLLWDYLHTIQKREPTLNRLFNELNSSIKPGQKAHAQQKLQKEIRDKIRSSDLNKFMNDMYGNLINDTLFETLYHGEKSNAFNRHKILHGENVLYNTQENVLKLFLIIDYIYDLFKDSAE